MSGLETEFPDKVVAQNLDATTEEATRVVQELGFKAHGLVIHADGEVRWKQADHEVDMNDVREAVKELIEAR